MAKHPHRLMLMDKKTWRCTLPGCSFFVHLGLAHVLIGKTAICWDCGEQFTFDVLNLKQEMPICDNCRLGIKGEKSLDEINAAIEEKMKQAKSFTIAPKGIEVINAHAADCAIYSGSECDCGVL